MIIIMIFFFINSMNLLIKIGVFGLRYYDFEFSARFWLILNLELRAKRPRAEPSQAENCSARALAQARSARTHLY